MEEIVEAVEAAPPGARVRVDLRGQRVRDHELSLLAGALRRTGRPVELRGLASAQAARALAEPPALEPPQLPPALGGREWAEL
ncbi:MAG: hypothetical protein QM767_18680 [Anaeromyxobacter sp.]